MVIKYSYLIQMFCRQLNVFKYFYLIQIIGTQLYGIKYSYLIQIIFTQLFGINRAIGLMCRVFTNGPGNRGESQVESCQRLKNGTCLALSIIRIKGKGEQSRERSSAPQHLSVVAIENGAFGSPTTYMVSNIPM